MSHAEYMRKWRAARKPPRLPDLDWPVNAFNQPMKVEDLFLEMASDSPVPKIGRIPDPMKCENPLCPQRHNHAVSRVIGGDGSRRVLWFCSVRCLNKHRGTP
jgi:hypothetical protein